MSDANTNTIGFLESNAIRKQIQATGKRGLVSKLQIAK